MKAAEENADKGAGFPYDKGQEMPGVKTVGGRGQRRPAVSPADGPQRREGQARPAGRLAAPGRRIREQRRRGAVPVVSSCGTASRCWSSRRRNRPPGPARTSSGPTKTAQEVGRLAGIDANRPILMGYSAGGQAVPMQWVDKPGEFGGLILDAAHPIRCAGVHAGPCRACPRCRKAPPSKARRSSSPGGADGVSQLSGTRSTPTG